MWDKRQPVGCPQLHDYGRLTGQGSSKWNGVPNVCQDKVVRNTEHCFLLSARWECMPDAIKRKHFQTVVGYLNIRILGG